MGNYGSRDCASSEVLNQKWVAKLFFKYLVRGSEQKIMLDYKQCISQIFHLNSKKG